MFRKILTIEPRYRNRTWYCLSLECGHVKVIASEPGTGGVAYCDDCAAAAKPHTGELIGSLEKAVERVAS